MAEGAKVGGSGAAVPVGVVTFLFSDVEGSTGLWARDRVAMAASLEVHDRVLRDAFESRGGYVFTTAGDSFAVAFSRASDAVAAARAAQDELSVTGWPGPVLRVRMGLHLGEAQERGGDYFGPVVNLTARLEAAGHGGQVLLSDQVRSAAEVVAVDLGRHRLRDVPEPVQIWQLGDVVFPPLRVADPTLTNLPAAATSLVGRAGDLRRISEALQSSRVVTLTAGGGTGKTRLAISAGEEQLAHRTDGVWFVDLTSVSDGSLVGAAVAGGLGLSLVAGDPYAQIVDYVADKDLLLVVDNCEHLVEECAELAERFLARPGRSVLLATSRERFDVNGEQVLSILPLSADDDFSAAVELFTQRATAVNSSFELTDSDRPVVAQLCRRLDGMPLAIELAATRCTVLTPAELLAGIEDRFALLGGGRRRQRQRTLEATLDWSYDLLEPEEQRVLRALGAFVGGFDLAAVAAIAGLAHVGAVDVMDSLVARSLVVHDQIDGRSRYRLFETTAAYARQHLVDAGEATDVRDRHLNYFHGLALQHPLAMFADLSAVQQLGADRANIAAAFDWAATHQRWTTAGELLLGAFTVFYASPSEGIELVDRCVEALPDTEHDLATRLSCNTWGLYNITAEYRSIMTSARRVRDCAEPLHQLHAHAMMAALYGVSNPAEATANLEQAYALLQELPPGLDTTVATAWYQHCADNAAMNSGDYERALSHARAAVRAQDELGFETGMSAQAVMTTALCASILGEADAAVQAAARYAELPSVFLSGDGLTALVHAAIGELDQANVTAQAHARLGVSGRIMQQATDSLLVLAALARAEGDLDTARELILAMGTCRAAEFVGYSRYLADQLDVRAAFDAAQASHRSRSTSREGSDTETLRHEMTRRGWN